MLDDLLGNMQPQIEQPVMAVPGAPADPVIENKGKWQQFFERMKDPNFRQAAMMTGAGLMRSPQYGQNGFDVAGQALQSGMQTITSLREADRMRALQTEDRNIAAQQRQEKTTQTGVENTQKDRELQQKAVTSNIYRRQVEGTEQNQVQDNQLASRAQTETERSNRAREENSRIAAQADLTRARAYSSGPQTPADIQKINNLSAKYVKDGMSDVDAKARATMVIAATGKAKSPGAMAQDLYKQRLTDYSNNPANFRNPLTPEMSQQMLEDAMQDALHMQGLDAPERATTPGVPPVAGTIDRTPTGGAQANPAIKGKVDRLKTMQVDPNLIRQAIIQEGADPKMYGY